MSSSIVTSDGREGPPWHHQASEATARPIMRLWWSLVTVFTVAQISLVFLYVEPGPLSIDEVLYHRMVKGLLDGHGFFIWNGFEEYPSPELEVMYARVVDGRLTTQYPYGYAVLAAPFYWAFGYRGLFLVNALSLVGVLIVTRHLGLRVLGDERVAVCAAVLLGAGTFAWEYGMAAWPHAVALLCAVAGVSATLASLQAGPGARRAVVWALQAGLVCGVGVSLRLDAILIVPALVLPFLLWSPIRIREALALVGGLVPGLAFCSYVNLVRWGDPNPLSYGARDGAADVWRYLPVGALAVIALAVLMLSTRPRAALLIQRHRASAAGGAAALVAILLFLPWTKDPVLRVATGMQALVVDIRSLPLDRVEPSMVRTETGAVAYFGGFKKALLQSCPFLVLGVVALVRILQAPRARWVWAWLLAIPALLAGFFSLNAWHGGLALNMRYLLPALPGLTILAAVALSELVRLADRRWPIVVAGGGLASGAAFWGLHTAGTGPARFELLLLTLPLLLAAALGILVLIGLSRPARVTATLALALSASAVTWSALVGLGYDAEFSRSHRAVHHRLAVETARHVEPDSLLFAEVLDIAYTVIEHRDRVRVALPWRDRFADAEPLVRHHQQAGRQVYALLSQEGWQRLEATGALAGGRPVALARVGPFVLGGVQPLPRSDASQEPR